MKPSLILNSSLCICPLTFITEALHLDAISKQFICLLLWIVRRQLQHLCLLCMMCCVTIAMPFQFIDGNILKSCRTGLTNHTQPISHHIMPLVINAIGEDTQTQAHIPTHKRKRFQETRCVWPVAMHAWFKKGIGIKSMHTIAVHHTQSSNTIDIHSSYYQCCIQ